MYEKIKAFHLANICYLLLVAPISFCESSVMYNQHGKIHIITLFINTR